MVRSERSPCDFDWLIGAGLRSVSNFAIEAGLDSVSNFAMMTLGTKDPLGHVRHVLVPSSMLNSLSVHSIGRALTNCFILQYLLESLESSDVCISTASAAAAN